MNEEEKKEFQNIGEALTFLKDEGDAVDKALKLYLHHTEELMIQLANALKELSK